MQEIFLNHHSNDAFSRSCARSFVQESKAQLLSSLDSQNAATYLQRALAVIFEQFGAQENDHFFFVSHSQEALFQLCYSLYADTVRLTGKSHLLTQRIPEIHTKECFKKFESLGCSSKWLKVNHFGQVTKEILEESLNPRIAFLSLPWANCLTGVIHPVADLAEVCRQNGIFFHVDGSLCFGQMFFRVRDFGFNFFTCEGLFPSAALLFVKEGSPLPHFYSESQINMIGILSLAYAVEKFSSWTDYQCMETARLRDKLEKGITEGFPDAEVFFKEAERLPGRTAIGFPGVESEALLYHLGRRNIHATRGGGKFPLLFDHLVECKVDPLLAKSAISFSLSHETKEQEIERAIEEIVKLAKKLRSYSDNLCS